MASVTIESSSLEGFL